MESKKKPIYRADHKGIQSGIFKHNKALLIKTATKCALCGLPINKNLKYPDPMSISIDHIIPISKGGKSSLDNLQATHLICNKQKGTKIIALSKKEIAIEDREKDLNFPQYIDWRNYKG